MTLDEMYATPGVYDVTSTAMQARGQYVRVEVDNTGVCHQLTPAGKRDGGLSREGWSADTIVLGEVRYETRSV